MEKEIACSTIESYSISVENLKSGVLRIDHVLNPSSVSYQLRDLTPGTKYRLKIAVMNSEGTGPFSPGIEFTTKG